MYFVTHHVFLTVTSWLQEENQHISILFYASVVIWNKQDIVLISEIHYFFNRQNCVGNTNMWREPEAGEVVWGNREDNTALLR